MPTSFVTKPLYMRKTQGFTAYLGEELPARSAPRCLQRAKEAGRLGTPAFGETPTVLLSACKAEVVEDAANHQGFDDAGDGAYF
jgi:hypothetical protein